MMTMLMMMIQWERRPREADADPPSSIPPPPQHIIIIVIIIIFSPGLPLHSRLARGSPAGCDVRWRSGGTALHAYRRDPAASAPGGEGPSRRTEQRRSS